MQLSDVLKSIRIFEINGCSTIYDSISASISVVLQLLFRHSSLSPHSPNAKYPSDPPAQLKSHEGGEGGGGEGGGVGGGEGGGGEGGGDGGGDVEEASF